MFNNSHIGSRVALSILTERVLPPSDKYVVLHIDDEDEQLFFAKTFLEESDPSLEIVSVKSAEELLNRLSEDVDCIVADYVMPDVNGMELCKIIKETHKTPFIMYTGRGSEVVAEAAFQSGVDDYVRKEADPSNYQLLARRIKSHAEAYRNKRDERRYQERLEGVRRARKKLGEVMGYTRGSFSYMEDDSRVLVECIGNAPDAVWGSDVLEARAGPSSGP